MESSEMKKKSLNNRTSKAIFAGAARFKFRSPTTAIKSYRNRHISTSLVVNKRSDLR